MSVATADSRRSHRRHRDRQDTFEEACRRADEKRRREAESERLTQLRRLLDDNVSLERAWSEINWRGRHSGAAQITVEALMFSLRSRGLRALSESDTQRRLSELDDAQVPEVVVRLQKLKPEIARAWSSEEVRALIRIWGRINAVS
jgi:hypothetical protein